MFRGGISAATSYTDGPILFQIQSDIEVNQPNVSLRRNHNVRRLNIAM